MSKHYAPSLENSLQSEFRKKGVAAPNSTNRYNRPPNQRQKYHKKIHVYEKMNLPCVMEMGADGDTHINTGDQAYTELGKMLSQSYRMPFNHSYLGEFQCINGLWSYVTSKHRNDRVRFLSGRELRQFNKSLESRRVDNFIYILLGAQWEKVNSNNKLKNMIKESTLPFDCYYLTRKKIPNTETVLNLRVRPKHAEWLIWGFEEIRKALKENREPEFESVMDDPDKDCYACVFPDMPKPPKKPEPVPALMDTPVETVSVEPETEIPDDIGNKAEETPEKNNFVKFQLDAIAFYMGEDGKPAIVTDRLTDEVISAFQEHYGDYTITQEDVIKYIVALMECNDHSPHFDDDPIEAMPCIVFAHDFNGFIESVLGVIDSAELQLRYNAVVDLTPPDPVDISDADFDNYIADELSSLAMESEMNGISQPTDTAEGC